MLPIGCTDRDRDHRLRMPTSETQAHCKQFVAALNGTDGETPRMRETRQADGPNCSADPCLARGNRQT